MHNVVRIRQTVFNCLAILRNPPEQCNTGAGAGWGMGQARQQAGTAEPNIRWPKVKNWKGESVSHTGQKSSPQRVGREWLPASPGFEYSRHRRGFQT